MPRLTAGEKVRRDARIVADRAHGLGWATIADRHGLSERHCRTIWTEQAAMLAIEDVGPLERVQEAILQYDCVLEDLALLAEQASHDAVRLGAVRSRLAAIEQRLVLFQMLGLLPRDLECLRNEREARDLARVLRTVFDRYGLPPEAEEEILSALNGKNGHSRNGS
jgi:hypothetical protein